MNGPSRDDGVLGAASYSSPKIADVTDFLRQDDPRPPPEIGYVALSACWSGFVLCEPSPDRRLGRSDPWRGMSQRREGETVLGRPL